MNTKTIPTLQQIWNYYFNQIQIQIIFGVEKHSNTNTTIFWFERSSKYEYYSVWKYLPIRIRISLFSLNYSNNIWISNDLLASVSDWEFLILEIAIASTESVLWGVRKSDRIRILLGFGNLTEYSSVRKSDRIWILFGFKNLTEHEY